MLRLANIGGNVSTFVRFGVLCFHFGIEPVVVDAVNTTEHPSMADIRSTPKITGLPPRITVGFVYRPTCIQATQPMTWLWFGES